MEWIAYFINGFVATLIIAIIAFVTRKIIISLQEIFKDKT
jgi:hypothetical protein